MARRQTEYARDLARAHSGELDYSWARTGNGGHVLDFLPAGYDAQGPLDHRHYREDGSRFTPVYCGCWVS